MDIAIGDAVARQFAELRSDDAVSGVIANASDSAQGASCACMEMCPQAVEGAFVDSKVVAVLIEELSGASPAEREVWTNLLRSPTSTSSLRHLFAHYHGNAPTQLQQTSGQVQVTFAETPQEISPPSSCEAPQRISLTCSCRVAETLPPKESAVIESAIGALQAATQLLKDAVDENLSMLSQLRDSLIEQRQQPKGEAAQAGDCPDHDED